MSEIEKLEKGEWFNFGAPEIASRKLNAAKLAQEFNAIPETEPDNGKNIHVGDNFLANYNWTVLDVGEVNIGDNVWIGPNTDIYTVNHPVTAMGRRDHLAKVLPVTIGNDVWLCGKVTVCPGVTIGNNVVVAAGSVVIHDVPDNVMVAGNPARVVKKVDFE